MADQEEQKFWLVWNPCNRNPIVRHAYLHEASAEAKRLAAINPGFDFYVLRAVGVARVTTVIYNEIQPTAFDTRELRKS